MSRKSAIVSGACLLLLTVLAACDHRELVLYLDWPAGLDRSTVASVRFVGFPSDISAPARELAVADQPFVYTLPEAIALPDEFSLQVDVLATTGCRTASGSVSASIPTGQIGPTTLHLPISMLRPALCTLTVDVAGSGSVTSDLPGISCTSGTCTHDYPLNTVVHLTATPAAGLRTYVFDAPLPGCQGSGVCVIPLTAEQTVHVRFLPATCATAGWCKSPAVPLPAAQKTLSAIWGKTPSELYLVGEGGTILQLTADGALTALAAPSATYLFGVAGDSTTFAVGAGGTLLDIAQTGVTAASQSGVLDAYGLTAVASDRLGNAWAVGLKGGLVRRQDGVWSLESANTDLSGFDLNGVWAASAKSVWAVGDNGVLLHSDGTMWSVASRGTLTTQDLHAVWGSSTTNIWAAGYSNALLHFDGTSWKPWVQDGGAPLTGNLYSLAGSSATDVWGVGEAGAIWHFDGTRWQKNPRSGMLTTGLLFGVYSASPWEAWAVGESGTLLVFQP